MNINDWKMLPCVKTENQKQYIFDRIRKKYVSFTPEEKVRQLFVQHLICNLNYPAGLIAIEKQIKLAQTNKRCDIVVYNKHGKAVVIVECKAPNIEINQAVYEQAAQYNLPLQVEYLILTNLNTTYCMQLDKQHSFYKMIDHLPLYENLTK